MEKSWNVCLPCCIDFEELHNKEYCEVEDGCMSCNGRVYNFHLEGTEEDLQEHVHQLINEYCLDEYTIYVCEDPICLPCKLILRDDATQQCFGEIFEYWEERMYKEGSL